MLIVVRPRKYYSVLLSRFRLRRWCNNNHILTIKMLPLATTFWASKDLTIRIKVGLYIATIRACGDVIHRLLHTNLTYRSKTRYRKR